MFEYLKNPIFGTVMFKKIEFIRIYSNSSIQKNPQFSNMFEFEYSKTIFENKFTSQPIRFRHISMRPDWLAGSNLPMLLILSTGWGPPPVSIASLLMSSAFRVTFSAIQHDRDKIRYTKALKKKKEEERRLKEQAELSLKEEIGSPNSAG